MNRIISYWNNFFVDTQIQHTGYKSLKAISRILGVTTTKIRVEYLSKRRTFVLSYVRTYVQWQNSFIERKKSRREPREFLSSWKTCLYARASTFASDLTRSKVPLLLSPSESPPSFSLIHTAQYNRRCFFLLSSSRRNLWSRLKRTWDAKASCVRWKRIYARTLKSRFLQVEATNTTE